MIKSKFYLIRGDGNPIYVGFTNRPIKQRFTEHKADKDFSDYNKVTIEKLDELDYEFTWDEDLLYKNANEVSVRESQLVKEYGTQDSKYQIAIGGGQVWTYEKNFVHTNKNNPRFVSMSGDDIDRYIEYRNSIILKLHTYTGSTVSPYIHNIRNYIVSSKFVVKYKVSNIYIDHTVEQHIRSSGRYISSSRFYIIDKLKGVYVGGTNYSSYTKISNYIKKSLQKNEYKAKVYIKGSVEPRIKKIKNYVDYKKKEY